MRCKRSSSLENNFSTSLSHFLDFARLRSSRTSCSCGLPPNSSCMVFICWCRKYSRCCLSMSVLTRVCISLRIANCWDSIVRCWSKSIERFMRSISSNNDCFFFTSAFMLEEMKLIKNVGLSMFLIANWASVGMLGESLIMFNANSFIESMMALNSLSFLGAFVSLKKRTSAFINGSLCVGWIISKRRLPWIITVVLPSGILSNRTIWATVPTVCTSENSGSSTSWFFWATTPIIRSSLLAFWTNLIDLSRPTVIGITTPGNKTLLRNGRIGISFGNSALFIVSSSSWVISGIKSASPSIGTLNSNILSSNNSLMCSFFTSICQFSTH